MLGIVPPAADLNYRNHSGGDSVTIGIVPPAADLNYKSHSGGDSVM